MYCKFSNYLSLFLGGKITVGQAGFFTTIFAFIFCLTAVDIEIKNKTKQKRGLVQHQSVQKDTKRVSCLFYTFIEIIKEPRHLFFSYSSLFAFFYLSFMLVYSFPPPSLSPSIYLTYTHPILNCCHVIVCLHEMKTRLQTHDLTSIEGCRASVMSVYS